MNADTKMSVCLFVHSKAVEVSENGAHKVYVFAVHTHWSFVVFFGDFDFRINFADKICLHLSLCPTFIEYKSYCCCLAQENKGEIIHLP